MSKENLKCIQIVLIVVIALLGLCSFSVELFYYNNIDGDVWERLAEGAVLWKAGSLSELDYAFTAVLPKCFNHEWGTSLITFSLLKIFGPFSLSIYRVLIACGVLIFIIATGRLFRCRWSTLFLLIIPCSLGILPGYIPVVRSHALTYLFFSITLYCLEKMYRGVNWPSFLMVFMMMVWTNVHGGFLAGLGMIGIYSLSALLFNRDRCKIFLLTLIAATGVTLINPYGIGLWQYLIPAVTLARREIAEWQVMTFFSFDVFIGFSILFILTCLIMVLARKNIVWRQHFAGLLIVLLTGYLGFKHRRHTVFFAIAVGSFMGPFLDVAMCKMIKGFPIKYQKLMNPLVLVLIIYTVFFVNVMRMTLPQVSFAVGPTAHRYPIRAVDILSHAKVEGNVVVSLENGGYVKWHLYPRIKISFAGRYETVYTKETSDMNFDFFAKRGEDWDRILKQYDVDFIIAENNAPVSEGDDLLELNYELIDNSGVFSLYASPKYAKELKRLAVQLPPQRYQSLDPNIPLAWL